MFSIEASSEVPIYLQLINQVEQLVITGQWAAGDAVPSVRKVASELAINPMTVSKAYNQLESMGLLQRQQGKGMTVGSSLRSPKDVLEPSIEQLAAQAYAMGVKPRELARWVTETATAHAAKQTNNNSK